jgi:lipoprotein NlpI
MTHDGPVSPWRFAIAPLIVFPLIGPALAVLVVAVPLALVSLFTPGPGGLLYFLFLGGWWIPGFYSLLAPPFFVTGILVALAGLVIRRFLLVVALVAAEFAFLAYFAFWHWLQSGAETSVPDYANLRSGFFGTAGSVLLVLVATAGCWLVLRFIKASAPQIASSPADAAPPSRWEIPVLAVALVAGAAGLAAMLAANARLPATAWRDCTQGGYDDRIRGCTVIVERPADESTGRRVTAYLRRGSAYQDLNRDLALAIADYTEAIRLDPLVAEGYGGRGLAYARLSRDDEAITDLDTALRLDANVLRPDTYRVYRSRGLANLRRREFDRAIADHTEEIRLTPFYADGPLHRGAAYRTKGDAERAIADFSEAIRIEPARPDGYIARGSVYFAQGDMDRALADFDEAIRRLPNHKLSAPAYRWRGEVLERKGDLAGALAAFETAVSLDPSDKDALAGRDRTRAALPR